MQDALTIAKNLGVYQNVTLNVIDVDTGQIVQTHSGHNMATNSMLYGIAHYLVGDGVLGQGSSMLSSYIPQYISVGTLGLKSQTPKGGLPDIVTDYKDQYPGYGSDGYDPNDRNNRPVYGLGKPYTGYSNLLTYKVGDKTTFKGNEYTCTRTIDRPMNFNSSYWSAPTKIPDSEGMELINTTRFPISFRDIEPETKAELPRTMDVVFSAMISTGVLTEYRGDRNQIYITEVGLWSKKLYVDVDNKGGVNGLLAGYRLMPKNTADHDNVTKIKQSILCVKANQVVQVVWKVQLGGMDDLIRDSHLTKLLNKISKMKDTDTMTVSQIKSAIY